MNPFNTLLQSKLATAEPDARKRKELERRTLRHRAFSVAKSQHDMGGAESTWSSLLDLAINQCKQKPTELPGTTGNPDTSSTFETFDRAMKILESDQAIRDYEANLELEATEKADSMLHGQDTEKLMIDAASLAMGQLAQRVPGIDRAALEALHRVAGSGLAFLELLEAGSGEIESAGVDPRLAELLADAFQNLGGIGGVLAAAAQTNPVGDQLIAPPEAMQAAEDGPRGKTVTLGQWSFRSPPGWEPKRVVLDNKIHFESPDKKAGLYANTYDSETAMSCEMDAAVAHMVATGLSLKRKFTSKVGHLTKTTIETYDPKTSYRILQVALSDGKTALRVALHDYECPDRSASNPIFDGVLASMRRQERPTSTAGASATPKRDPTNSAQPASPLSEEQVKELVQITLSMLLQELRRAPGIGQATISALIQHTGNIDALFDAFEQGPGALANCPGIGTKKAQTLMASYLSLGGKSKILEAALAELGRRISARAAQKLWSAIAIALFVFVVLYFMSR